MLEPLHEPENVASMGLAVGEVFAAVGFDAEDDDLSQVLLERALQHAISGKIERRGDGKNGDVVGQVLSFQAQSMIGFSWMRARAASLISDRWNGVTTTW